MRKERLLFWTVSLVMCALFIMAYNKKQNEIPYEERTAINICCDDLFKEELKKRIEKSSAFEDTHKVVFIDNKEQADFVLTSEITSSDEGYKKIGWAPLVVAINEDKDSRKIYKKDKYLIEDNNGKYTIDFNKIINDSISGTWTEKIYCPKQDTPEGKMFYDFLLITVNNGKYPKESEMNACKYKVTKFLNSKVVIESNVYESLKSKKVVKKELYIIFENVIEDMTNSSYEFIVSYPINTITKTWYYKFPTGNKKLEEWFYTETFTSSGNRLEDLMYFYLIRNTHHDTAYRVDTFNTNNGYSYTEIPLKDITEEEE